MADAPFGDIEDIHAVVAVNPADDTVTLLVAIGENFVTSTITDDATAAAFRHHDGAHVRITIVREGDEMHTLNVELMDP